MSWLIRTHHDSGTVDSTGWGSIDMAEEEAEHITTHGVWLTEMLLYPPSRVVYIELIKENDGK